jgi:glycyl-tRNA synthetase beta chain
VFDRGTSRCLYTPRRMTLLLSGVAARQPDRQLDRRGPAVSAAFDPQGKPTPAALGFARSVGMEVADLQTLSTDAGEWLHCKVDQPGQALTELLFPILQGALARLPVPKPMRWSDHDFSFVRPVHWLLVLHGEQVLAGELFGCAADRLTRGHRIHAPGPHPVARPEEYLHTLRQAFVEGDPDLRRARIREGVEQAGRAADGVARITDSLLDEVNNLVEWPIAIACDFDTAFLDVPQEALIASMEDHQKFFPVLEQADGRLTARFIAVANIESRDVDAVRQGFERVVRPRLADARFFWNQDRKTALADRLANLDEIVFQEKLGSIGNKSRRLEALSRNIAKTLGLPEGPAARAALLCKCDLPSLMVGEFPELQGTMGAYYALASGEPGEVAAAIGSHYQPRYSGDQLPTDAAGRVVSIADRLDTLVGVFAAGQRPTGNRDPFGLRRSALGIIRMLLESGPSLSLSGLVDMAADALGDQLETDAETRAAVLDFMLERLRQWLKDQGYSARQLQAVMTVPDTRPGDILQRVEAVNAFMADEQGASLVAANKRIGNILKKSGQEITAEIDESSLLLPAEKMLFEAVNAARSKVEPRFERSEYAAALASLAALNAPVNAYFDEVMVMDEDPRIRSNRLSQLAALKALFDRVADFSLAD